MIWNCLGWKKDIFDNFNHIIYANILVVAMETSELVSYVKYSVFYLYLVCILKTYCLALLHKYLPWR